jgi:hypothetical protein
VLDHGHDVPVIDEANHSGVGLRVSSAENCG